MSEEDGNHNITFRIYDTETGGNQLWAETYAVTTKLRGVNYKWIDEENGHRLQT